jgi:hypothetical protein
LTLPRRIRLLPRVRRLDRFPKVSLVQRLLTHADLADEVEGLKDTIGGGEVLDESEGYTRSSNKDAHPMKGEEELDAKIDAATEA